MASGGRVGAVAAASGTRTHPRKGADAELEDNGDPLLGLPMRYLDIGTFQGGDDEEDYVRGDMDGADFRQSFNEDEFEQTKDSVQRGQYEEDEEEDAATRDRLFPSEDFTEDYTQIDPSQSFGVQSSSVQALFNDSSPEVSPAPPSASQGTALQNAPLALTSNEDEDGLLPGEALQLKVTDALFLPDKLLGTLLVTSYRLEFIPNQQVMDQTKQSTWRASTYFKFPVTSIVRIAKKPSFPSDELTVFCKDGRQSLLFKFSSEHLAKRAHSLLLTLAFPISQGVGYRWFFCFSQPSKTNPAFIEELLRCPAPESFKETRFRETTVNRDFSLCPSYPKTFYVPKQITDHQLKQIAQFRSKGRIPALCWFDKRFPGRGGSLWRCSQPKVGFGASFSTEDEAYVETIRRGTATGSILIVDCRSAMAAMANKARGMGTEDVSRYRGTKMQFENIANYHAIRSSYLSLCRLLNKPVTREGAADETFNVDVENTKWLAHIRAILSTAIKTAEAAGLQGQGVIVHCSDGWDRTSQVCALAQVLLDPDCRTREGFVRMVHREWVLFGHKFRDRLGVGIDAEESEERAPIFIEFLDCVWQLKRLFPTKFEFNQLFLEALAYHSYSSRFVEFMGNTAQDWETALTGDAGGSSLWEMLLQDPRSESMFRDLSWSAEASGGMLIPRITAVCRQVTLWDMFLRHCASPSHVDHALEVPFIVTAEESRGKQQKGTDDGDASSILTSGWEWWM